jgi:predicted AlkP superfamily pyrophosphatase or phosphodiesterase
MPERRRRLCWQNRITRRPFRWATPARHSVSGVLATWAALLLAGAGSPGLAAPVLMISVDGLKPEYVLEAQARGLKIPYLRSLISNGTYAQGVIGVWPTVTYPSHTTLVTGVSPAEHGILANVEFDPEHHFAESWFWYAAQIRTPTLWHAAHAAGWITASVGWPVTVGAADIDYLIPEYWRVTGPTENLNPSDRHLINALSRPDDLIEKMRDSAGEYLMGNDITLKGDEIKTRFAIEILRKHKPRFMTLHLSSLDETEHASGPFSAEANQDLESIDAMLSQLSAAAHASDAASIVAVVSDHGFVSLTHRTNLFVAFLNAGLIRAAQDADTKTLKITSWRAEPWLAGGMAAVMLYDPSDQQAEQEAGKVLAALASDPNNGIARVVSRAQIKQLGGFPDAAYLVVLKPGYYAGGNLTGEIAGSMPGNHGGHGFSPEYPEMRAAFFISGMSIARHRDLGVVDMRQIAPTLAALLGVPLPSAQAIPLHVGQ